MEALPIILAVVGTAASFAGSMQQSKAQKRVAGQQQAAAEQSKRIAGQNAAAIEAETAETVRREGIAANTAQSKRRALAAAGGGTTYGSTGAFLDEQRARETDYINWLKKSGQSQAAIEREKGQYSFLTGSAAAAGTKARAKATKTKAFVDLTSGGSNIYSAYADL